MLLSGVSASIVLELERYRSKCILSEGYICLAIEH